MTDREERTGTTEYPYHIGENSPLVSLLVTLVLLAVIVLVFWFITAASMETMSHVTVTG